MSKLSLKAVQKLTCKKRDAWWTVLLVDPIATRLVCVLARWNFVTPNRVTWAALFVGLGSAYYFFQGDWVSLCIGAALYHLSFILDCIDGKLARLKGNGTIFGGWLDYVFDRIRVLICALTLMGGQFVKNDEEVYLLAALVVIFLDMLRYVDALQIYKMRMSMRAKIAAVTLARQAEQGVEEEERKVVFIEDLLRENPWARRTSSSARARTPSRPRSSTCTSSSARSSPGTRGCATRWCRAASGRTSSAASSSRCSSSSSAPSSATSCGPRRCRPC